MATLSNFKFNKNNMIFIIQNLNQIISQNNFVSKNVLLYQEQYFLIQNDQIKHNSFF